MTRTRRLALPAGFAALAMGCSSATSGGGAPDAGAPDSAGPGDGSLDVGQDVNAQDAADATSSSMQDASEVGAATEAGDGDAGASSVGDAGGAGDSGEGGGTQPSEAGSDAGPCSSSQLYCGGLCVPDDAVNCGACGHDCTALHATSTPGCTAGACTFPSLTCAAGWGHCTGAASAGCETDLSQAANCGGCNNACTSGAVCAGAAGSYGCLHPTAIACASTTTFALMSDGTIEAWGANSGSNEISGALLGNGDDTISSSMTPVKVSGITTATAIAGGDGHACAILADKTVDCWGDNTFGQLGLDASNTSTGITGTTVPTPVPGLSNVIGIALGISHTCALIQGGTVKCWGSNIFDELGSSLSTSCNGGGPCSSTPIAVPGLTGVTAITIGADEQAIAGHTCALLTGGTVKCWGYNYDGELGDGTTTTASPYGKSTPVQVSGITTATAITGFNMGVCALLTGGSVKCWGYNVGDLGNGNTTSSSTPVPVSGLTNAASLSVGSTTETVCAVRTAGTAVCWGDGANGQLGNDAPDGGAPATSDAPVAVYGLTGVASIATGEFHTTALLGSGAIYGWGADLDGEIDNAAAGSATNPSPLLESF